MKTFYLYLRVVRSWITRWVRRAWAKSSFTDVGRSKKRRKASC